MSRETAANKMSAEPVARQRRTELEQRVAALRQAGIIPRLVVVTDNNRGRIAKYIGYKTKMAERLGVEVDVATPATREAIASHLKQASSDPEVSGVILQFPVTAHAQHGLPERTAMDRQLLDHIADSKDVDGLNPSSSFKPATALGIRRLMQHYVPDFASQNIALFGYGKLVNEPLHELLSSEGADNVSVIDVATPMSEQRSILDAANIIVSASGAPGSLNLKQFNAKSSKIIFDAGTAEHDGKVVGDASNPLRIYAEQEPNWKITPRVGGVGPMTVLELLGNVVVAAENAASNDTAFTAWGSDAMTPQMYVDQLAYPVN